jgi:UPF0755 protein
MDDIRPPRPRAPIRKLPLIQAPTTSSPVVPQPSTPVPPLKKLELAKKISKKHHWLWVIGGILIVMAGLIIAIIAWYNTALQARSNTENRVKITIESGATVAHVADELEQKQVIKSSAALQLYARFHDKSQLHIGTYVVSPHQRPTDILNKLISGKSDSYNVTILPGKTLKGIKTALEAAGFESAAIDKAFQKQYDHPLFQSKPADVNLEGYIFPETYQINSDTTVEALLRKTFDEFYARIQQKGLEQAVAERGLTLHQAITLASMVQLEVSKVDDQRQVAQVFEKRLKVGMTLGSDVTFFYAAEITGLEPSVEIDSPYNTRKYPGLPPGAIANFNLAALEAVANPAKGDYLYFVAGDDGVTHFSRTNEEHLQNVHQYCIKLCT